MGLCPTSFLTLDPQISAPFMHLDPFGCRNTSAPPFHIIGAPICPLSATPQVREIRSRLLLSFRRCHRFKNASGNTIDIARQYLRLSVALLVGHAATFSLCWACLGSRVSEPLLSKTTPRMDALNKCQLRVCTFDTSRHCSRCDHVFHTFFERWCALSYSAAGHHCRLRLRETAHSPAEDHQAQEGRASAYIYLLECVGVTTSKDMPPHGFLLGHLLQAAAATDALPPGIMTDYAVGNMAKSFPDGVFYLDTWPVSPPILVITTPTAANALQKYSPALDKPEDIKGPLNKYCAGPTLMTLDEKSWKTWRAIFNPSFSTSYLLQLAPNIAREIAIFQGILSKKMEDGYVFGLEPLTSRLAVDIMGKVSL